MGAAGAVDAEALGPVTQGVAVGVGSAVLAEDGHLLWRRGDGCGLAPAAEGGWQVALGQLHNIESQGIPVQMGSQGAACNQASHAVAQWSGGADTTLHNREAIDWSWQVCWWAGGLAGEQRHQAPPR